MRRREISKEGERVAERMTSLGDLLGVGDVDQGDLKRLLSEFIEKEAWQREVPMEQVAAEFLNEIEKARLYVQRKMS